MTDEPGTLLHRPVTPGGGPAVMQRTPETLYYDVYRSYYYLGGQRIAQRRQSATLFLDELLYLFTDHLGTVRLETYGNGPSEGQMRAATPKVDIQMSSGPPDLLLGAEISNRLLSEVGSLNLAPTDYGRSNTATLE